MAVSSCPKCHKTEFELAEKQLRGGGYTTNALFVQCASCGAVLGVLDYFNVTHILREIEAKVDKILYKV
jgi:uncharacterized Zn finger protein